MCLRRRRRRQASVPQNQSYEQEADETMRREVIGSQLVNLSEHGLDSLDALDNSVLANALQGIRDEIEHPEEAVAGFQSSL
jgi:FXSXX-COOH protein